jgi:hypothetical protein
MSETETSDAIPPESGKSSSIEGTEDHRPDAVAEAIVAAAAGELEHANRKVYMLAGMVYGVLMALCLVLIFQRGRLD